MVARSLARIVWRVVLAVCSAAALFAVLTARTFRATARAVGYPARRPV